MRRLLIPIVLAVGLVALFIASVSVGTPASTAPPAPETRAEIEAALGAAAARNVDTGLAYVVFEIEIDRLRVSADGSWAVIWIAALDRETGDPIAVEPGLAIGRFLDNSWRVFLPPDPEFQALFRQLPADIFPQAERDFWQDSFNQVCDTSAIGPFAGYKLPWAGGQTLWLTQSIYHTLGWGSNPSFSMIHSFDFSTSPSGLFDVWAARPGTVKYFYDSQADNDPTSPGNYIVLEDTGTNPTSYQLYLHLAQSSIPANLKVVGTPVRQGEKVGVADDTGASTNHHLHFQVHTEVSWWGCSVDILFSDVAINGGRPRLPAEAQTNPEYGSQGQTTYVSGNSPPPSESGAPGGGVTTPAIGQLLTQTAVLLSGYAFDYQSGLASAQFAVQFGSGWQPVGTLFSYSPAATITAFFSDTVDLCSYGVPDGPVSVGLMAQDVDGNTLIGGLAVPVILNADCAPPPPACQPAVDEVALYELPDYQGDCLLLPAGTHLQTLPVSSLLVGSDVYVTLYLSSALRARSQTFSADNANLSDDRSGNDVFAAALVQPRSQAPGVPSLNWPVSGEGVPEEHTINLGWHDGGGSDEFQARLHGLTETITSSWTAAPFWEPGILESGAYTWEVRARNTVSTTSWSPADTFAISTTNPVTATGILTAPLTENFDNGTGDWFGSGYWNLLADAGVAYNGANAWWYGTPPGDYGSATYSSGTPNGGSLTSPPIYIPGSGYNLRYYSSYQTEGDGRRWDRRRVLISADGGPFVEAYLHEYEAMDTWLRSPFIDLDLYAGQSIRIRFVFETLDARYNDFAGWLIDQVTIKSTPPPVCTAANEPDNTPAQATLLTYGSPASAEICPAGDIDTFMFSGTVGDRVGVDIDALAIGSSLDAYVALFDSDGISLLAENDDEIPGTLLDPLLGYTLPRTGTYYLMVRKASHPSVATNSHFYTLRVDLDGADPIISSFSVSDPLSDINSVPASVTLTAVVSDVGTGIQSVEFLYHSNDWGDDDWASLGIDPDGSDGWSAVWDTTLLAPEPGMALLVVARDRAGNIAAQGLWNLFPLPNVLYLPLSQRQ